MCSMVLKGITFAILKAIAGGSQKLGLIGAVKSKVHSSQTSAFVAVVNIVCAV